jgi:hypothetical protein
VGVLAYELYFGGNPFNITNHENIPNIVAGY